MSIGSVNSEFRNSSETMNKEKLPSHSPSSRNQYFAAFVVFLLLINYGILTGYVSPALDLLTSDESPLPTGRITMDEASWIASIALLGALFGSFAYGFIINWFGRKWPAISLSVPLIINWLLVIFAKNVYYLYVARSFQGLFLGGIIMTIPVYFVEIANDNIRGVLISFIAIGYAVGVFLAFMLVCYCNYYVTPIYAITSTCIFVAIFIFFPETPIFLVRQNKITRAEDSLRFYQRIPAKDRDSIQSEIEKLKDAVGTLKSEKCLDKRFKSSDFTTKPGRQAMIIAIVLALLVQFTGITNMLAYTVTIFGSSGSALSPNLSSVIVGLTKLVGTFVSIALIDRAGRRFLYIVSTIGCAISQIILGVYMMLVFNGFAVDAFNWIPIISFSVAILFSALAVQGLTLGVIAEIMPDKIKEFGVTFALSLTTSTGFIVLKCFPWLVSLIGFHGCMFFYAGVGLLGAIFVIKFLPETKNKSYEEIMEALT